MNGMPIDKFANVRPWHDRLNEIEGWRERFLCPGLGGRQRWALVHRRDRGRSVGPRGHQNEERRDALRIVPCRRYRRTVKICAPVGDIGVGKEEHQMRMPMASEVAQVSLFRHHESHRAGLRRCDAVRGKFSTSAVDHVGL